VPHQPRGVNPVDGLTAPSPHIADPWLATAERRLLHPVVPPAGWSYLLAAGPACLYRSALAEGRPLIEIVCDDDVGITGWSCLRDIGAVFAAGPDANGRPEPSFNGWTALSTAPPRSPRSGAARPVATRVARGGRPTTRGSAVLPRPASGHCGLSR
jgi:hypothetical protein